LPPIGFGPIRKYFSFKKTAMMVNRLMIKTCAEDAGDAFAARGYARGTLFPISSGDEIFP
jgi:hypothetical protein